VVGQHSFPVSYGALIVVAMNELIIPALDPFASNLEELFGNAIDCYAIGLELAATIGLGSPDLYEGACEIAISAAAHEIEDTIAELGVFVFTISGDAKPQDTNTDRKVDVLLNGLWEGTLSYSGTPATLARPDQTFRGERMNVP
jgi:hypothetical protein